MKIEIFEVEAEEAGSFLHELRELCESYGADYLLDANPTDAEKQALMNAHLQMCGREDRDTMSDRLGQVAEDILGPDVEEDEPAHVGDVVEVCGIVYQVVSEHIEGGLHLEPLEEVFNNA